MNEATVLPADAGAFSVLVPLIVDGKVLEVFPSPVLAWVLGDTGVVGVVTPGQVYPAGIAIWTPDGYVESEDGQWLDPDAYLKHLQESLLQ
jgi:hypothetical protein